MWLSWTLRQRLLECCAFCSDWSGYGELQQSGTRPTGSTSAATGTAIWSAVNTVQSSAHCRWQFQWLSTCFWFAFSPNKPYRFSQGGSTVLYWWWWRWVFHWSCSCSCGSNSWWQWWHAINTARQWRWCNSLATAVCSGWNFLYSSQAETAWCTRREIPVVAMRDVEISLLDQHGRLVTIREHGAISAQVHQPVISFGKLLQSGWGVCGVEQSRYHAPTDTRIPIELRN